MTSQNVLNMSLFNFLIILHVFTWAKIMSYVIINLFFGSPEYLTRSQKLPRNGLCCCETDPSTWSCSRNATAWSGRTRCWRPRRAASEPRTPSWAAWWPPWPPSTTARSTATSLSAPPPPAYMRINSCSGTSVARVVDPDPDPHEFGGSRRTKMTHKYRKK